MLKPLHDQLNDAELEFLAGTVTRIALLVGSADGHFSAEEKDAAERLVHVRSFSHPAALEGLYERAFDEFHATLDSLLTNFDGNFDDLHQSLETDLTRVNTILQKLEYESARMVVESLRSFAWHIAKSSGGFLGMGAISKAEEHWIHLPMIQEPANEE